MEPQHKIHTVNMRFLIIDNNAVFYTQWYDYDNNYFKGMKVIDLHRNMYTSDGLTWNPIEEDNL